QPTPTTTPHQSSSSVIITSSPTQSTNRPTEDTNPDSSSDNTGVIVGAVMGLILAVLLFLAMVLLLVFILCRRRYTNEAYGTTSGSGERDIPTATNEAYISTDISTSGNPAYGTTSGSGERDIPIATNEAYISTDISTSDNPAYGTTSGSGERDIPITTNEAYISTDISTSGNPAYGTTSGSGERDIPITTNEAYISTDISTSGNPAYVPAQASSTGSRRLPSPYKTARSTSFRSARRLWSESHSWFCHSPIPQYWYQDSSIVASPTLRETLMSILFGATELDFQLQLESAAFLDETWVIPVFIPHKLPPIKTLDIRVGYCTGRAIVVEIEKGCLAEKISADPADINVLPEYSRDPRVVSNLLDGVHHTKDDLHMWLAPFTPSQPHTITISLSSPTSLAVVRVWNYNKSRLSWGTGHGDVAGPAAHLQRRDQKASPCHSLPPHTVVEPVEEFWTDPQTVERSVCHTILKIGEFGYELTVSETTPIMFNNGDMFWIRHGGRGLRLLHQVGDEERNICQSFEPEPENCEPDYDYPLLAIETGLAVDGEVSLTISQRHAGSQIGFLHNGQTDTPLISLDVSGECSSSQLLQLMEMTALYIPYIIEREGDDFEYEDLNIIQNSILVNWTFVARNIGEGEEYPNLLKIMGFTQNTINNINCTETPYPNVYECSVTPELFKAGDIIGIALPANSSARLLLSFLFSDRGPIGYSLDGNENLEGVPLITLGVVPHKSSLATPTSVPTSTSSKTSTSTSSKTSTTIISDSPSPTTEDSSGVNIIVIGVLAPLCLVLLTVSVLSILILLSVRQRRRKRPQLTDNVAYNIHDHNLNTNEAYGTVDNDDVAATTNPAYGTTSGSGERDIPTATNEAYISTDISTSGNPAYVPAQHFSIILCGDSFECGSDILRMRRKTSISGRSRAGMATAAVPESSQHPLLQELNGVLHRLKTSPQPIQDGTLHLIPFCETLELVFRHGLKQPNSWFGLNKQDYWSWIEPLQDYYFNEKQNPLLRDAVQEVCASPHLRTLQGKGRCFLRIALCKKLISVPFQHLVKNSRLTSYWYQDSSIVASPTLRETLMSILFGATELDFQLQLESAAFLDETWVIPVFIPHKLPPIKTLDIRVGYCTGRAIVVEIEKGCLAEKAGVEPGDCLVELCGEPVYHVQHQKLRHLLVAKPVDTTDLVIVKNLLPDGCPFYPISSRKLQLDSAPPSSPRSPKSPPSIQSLFSKSPSPPTLPSPTSSAHFTPPFPSPSNSPSISPSVSPVPYSEYHVAFLGRLNRLYDTPNQSLINDVIARVLTTPTDPCDLVIRVGKSECCEVKWMASVFVNLRAKWTIFSPFFHHSTACSGCRNPFTTRFCSSSSSDDTTEQLETFEGPIPREKLSVTYSKSSGPGGQNVNKLNTKAEVRFHVASADWLPQRVRERLLTLFRSRITREGEMIITSQEHRSQHRNLEAAVARLEGMVCTASEVPRGPSGLTLARIRVLKKKAQQRKRVEKKYHSQKKHDRRTTDID
ncbi:Peptidyl-tRNA hydrolase ICT1, mitochondrial, partial [Geodia barretti]